MQATITVEVNATELFEGESVNWRYCRDRAAFSHREACEFVLHVGSDGESSDYYKERCDEMRAYGCTEAFLDAYAQAARLGAMRVLFYA